MTECAVGQEHQTAPPTLTSDRVCAAGTACRGAQYENKSATITANAVCDFCAGCDQVGERVTSVCTPFRDTVCNTTGVDTSVVTRTKDSAAKDTAVRIVLGAFGLLALVAAAYVILKRREDRKKADEDRKSAAETEAQLDNWIQETEAQLNTVKKSPLLFASGPVEDWRKEADWAAHGKRNTPFDGRDPEDAGIYRGIVLTRRHNGLCAAGDKDDVLNKLILNQGVGWKEAWKGKVHALFKTVQEHNRDKDIFVISVKGGTATQWEREELLGTFTLNSKHFKVKCFDTYDEYERWLDGEFLKLYPQTGSVRGRKGSRWLGGQVDTARLLEEERIIAPFNAFKRRPPNDHESIEMADLQEPLLRP